MGIFDRRKDPKAAEQPEPPAPPAPPAPSVEPEAAVPEQSAAATEAPAPVEPTTRAEPEPEPEPDREPAPGRHIHTVAAGESLADLASRYGVAAEEIARQNHLAPAGAIHAGQVLVIADRGE